MLVAWEWDARGIIAELFNLIVLNLAAPSLPQVSPECVCRCYAFAKHMDDSHIDGSRLARVRRSGLVSYCHIFIRRRDVSRMAFEAVHAVVLLLTGEVLSYQHSTLGLFRMLIS